MPSSETNTLAICKQIQDNYSSCDVNATRSSKKTLQLTKEHKISDALVVLKVPYGGHLSDILPAPHAKSPSRRIIAPISTVLFVPHSHQNSSSPTTTDGGTTVPAESNIPKDKHWTDVPAPGSIALLQQPSEQKCAVLGDIVATRFKIRGVAGAIIDGRMRDVAGCAELCAEENFAVWSKGVSTSGTTPEAKAWAVDVPLRVGGVEVRPGDFAVLDEAERGIVVIPKEKLVEVAEVLPGLKEADDAVLRDVQAGVGLKEAFQRHREHYTHRT